ncbi:MAG: protein translocase subunit SecD [Planctomycetes bacterium]|nr:protein translocase subunit SecD [Planctomycetota bacterium]
MRDTRARLIIIVVASLLLAYVAAPIKDKPMPGILSGAKINLGIDLAGGAELTYRLLWEEGKSYEKDRMGNQVVHVLQNRINTRGLKEPRITTRGEDYVLLQLAGVDQDALEDFKNLISQVGKLELKKVATREVHERFNTDGIVPDGFEAYSPQKEVDSATHPWIKTKVLVEKTPVITGEDIASAYHTADIRLRGGAGWRISFTLHADGAKKFDAAAEELYKRDPKGQIAIIIDNQLKSAPAVQSDAFGGSGEITGGFSEREAEDLATVLRSGSLPVSIGKLEDGMPKERIPEAENFVGPSLGQDAIMRGLWASITTLLGVALFMMVYYRVGGIIAVVTLVLNLVYLMAIMAFFGATLTLPGIAGIALTVGMAVDANILIYERMREELTKGKTLAQAFEAGHDRAFVTIMDSNLTTLLAALVLYWLGTGPVQGFAVTLSIGILTTLVSVLFVGKTILEVLITRGAVREMRMMKILANPNYQFVKYLKPAVLISLLVIAASLTVFGIRGKKNFGIDFNGGSVLNFAFGQPKSIDEVRATIRGIKDAGGHAKYPDAEVQTVAEPGTTFVPRFGFSGSASRQFALRERTQDLDQLRRDVKDVWKNDLSQPPFEEIPQQDLPEESRYFASGPAGGGWYVYLRTEDALKFEDAQKKITEALGKHVGKDPNSGAPEVRVELTEGAPKGVVKLRVVLSDQDVKADRDLLRKMRDEIKTLSQKGELKLSSYPFLVESRIGPAVAEEFRNKSALAMMISWGLMIIYIAFRFSSARFGIAAVIALIHDALISIGLVAVLGTIVPKTWGLSFDMNMTFVAAILTIIGFSINDTIVIFDRIRENLALMKKESFSEIINVSVNQTLSRTILTALTVWITVIVLYLATMTSGGGIAEFSLPLIIGVLAGSYSTVFIAAPIVLWWYRGQKPNLS